MKCIRHFLLVLVAAVFVTTLPACGGGKYTVMHDDKLRPTPDDGHALVYVLRPSLVGWTVKIWSFADDQLLGVTHGKNYTFAQVPAGEHVLWSKPENERRIKTTLEAGKTYYLHQSIVPGMFRPTSLAEFIEEKEAEKMLKKCRYVRHTEAVEEKVKSYISENLERELKRASTTKASCPVSSSDLAMIQAQAESGDAKAQYRVAGWYRSGRCLPQNSSAARVWYHRSAEQGHIKAIRSLGSMHLEANFDEAVKWFQIAVEKGDAHSAHTLGNIYYWGKYTPRDLDEAEKWFRLAIQQGDPFSRGQLDSIIRERDPVAWTRKEQERIAAEEERKLELEEEKKKQAEEELRRAEDLFGTIAVVILLADTEVQPASSAIEGASHKPLKMLVGVPLGALAGALLGYGIGAVPGAFDAAKAISAQPSKRKVRVLQEKMTAAYDLYKDEDVLDTLQAQITRTADEQLNNHVLVMPLKEMSDPINYLGVTSADTVLEIRAVVSGLQLVDAREEQAKLFMTVTYRVKRVKDNTLLDELKLDYIGAGRSLDTWAEDDGSTLREALRAGYAAIAKQTVNGLLSLAARQHIDSSVSE